jgi:hypothetical protein
MDELEKGLAIAITGAPRTKALEAFRQYIKEWKVALPAIAPLVLDFGLGEFDKTGLGTALLLELSMPCEIDDNDFADERIPIGKSRVRSGSCH